MSKRVFGVAGGRGRVAAMGGLVLALSLVAAPSLAYQQESQTGYIGDVFAKDTFEHPGGVCIYDGNHMVSFTLRTMKLMWADNNTNKREHGTAQLRATLEEYNGSDWAVVKKSAPVTRTLYDDVKTTYPAITINYDTSFLASYRGGFSIKWYKANGDLRGKSQYFLDYHKIQDIPGSSESPCYGNRAA